MAEDGVRISNSLYATMSNEANDDVKVNNVNSTTTDDPNAFSNILTIESSDSIELTRSPTITHDQQQNQQGPSAPPPPSSTSRSKSKSKSSSISFSELNYGMSSYHAIVLPVTVTMVLSAITVIFIQTPEIDTASSLNKSYNLFSTSDEYSTGKNLGLSLVNALVIVCAVAAATFGLVLLYKYRCMRFLSGYMILSSALLLGLLGSVVSMVAIQKYKILIDFVTFFFLLYNFAIVGTMSIFFSNGIPTYITQSYLVITSVILAWQLSQFNDWTAWCLLVMLALYDLCAVLTPCGPLKALVNLMSKDDAPMLPGLLYEAKLPDGVERRSRNSKTNSNANASANANANANTNTNTNINGATENNRNGGKNLNRSNTNGHSGNGNTGGTIQTKKKNTSNNEQANSLAPPSNNFHENNNNGNHQCDHGQRIRMNNDSNTYSRNSNSNMESQIQSQNPGTATLPLAIACIYKLHILSPPEFSTQRNIMVDGSNGTGGGQRRSRSNYNEEELSSDVVVKFPRNGGYVIVDKPIVESPPPESSSSLKRFFGRNKRKNDLEAAEQEQQQNTRYIVYDRNDIIKRTLIMDPNTGKIFEEVINDDENSGALGSNSIKLGLGDFIFYSVLVSKAAQYSFTTFASCVLVILAGLGGTLVLLSVFHMALPALPISIFLGVTFYFLTRVLIEPHLIEAMLIFPVYV